MGLRPSKGEFAASAPALGPSRRPMLLPLALSLIAAASPVSADSARAFPVAGPPALQASRAGGHIHVDGRLDEPAWAAAPPATRFTQHDPLEGQPASERTEVRVLVG